MATPRRANVSAESKELALAKAIQTSDFTRVYLEASLLATDDVEQISELFGIPTAVVNEY